MLLGNAGRYLYNFGMGEGFNIHKNVSKQSGQLRDHSRKNLLKMAHQTIPKVKINDRWDNTCIATNRRITTLNKELL